MKLQSIIALAMLIIFSACTDYAAKMEDDHEEWKTVVVDEFADPRDGKIYKTVTIGWQIWMAQNLNYETENSYCYNDDPTNCVKYGRLYTWGAAITACPSGWHLPSKVEFEILVAAVGGQSIAGKMLKSTVEWNNSGYGTDAYAFSALPAGSIDSYGYYFFVGDYVYFWSSTEYDSNDSFYMFLDCNEDYAHIDHTNDEVGFSNSSGLSVRCLKD